MAGFPSKPVAEKSFTFRTLGLGYANLGSLLMKQGIPYDSPKALATCGALSAILTGEAYATSAEMAAALGPFPGLKKTATTCCGLCGITEGPREATTVTRNEA